MKREKRLKKKIKKVRRTNEGDKNYIRTVEGKVWLYGIHAVSDALRNKQRIKHKLILTTNTCQKMREILLESRIIPEVVDPRKFNPPIERTAVHQGIALEVSPVRWGTLSKLCAPQTENKLVLLLDRVTDPQNVGAILRSAEVFGATAVAAPSRNSASESGVMAKAASGALERQPYLKIPNLYRDLKTLKKMGYFCIGFDARSEIDATEGFEQIPVGPVALVVGAEGKGLRDLTRRGCDRIFKIPSYGKFGSLNVSNAAAIALFTARTQINSWR